MTTLKHPQLFQYSVAISPPDIVIERVRQLKQELRSAIGWYPSVNALAHITFNVFRSDTPALLQWEKYIAHFAAQQSPVSLRFNRTDAFSNGAFFLAPDEASEHVLTDMMQDFHRLTPFSTHQSVKPHISIARRLNTGQLAIARALIPAVDIRFVCNDLVLRHFNESRKQYDIYRRFEFGRKGQKIMD